MKNHPVAATAVRMISNRSPLVLRLILIALGISNVVVNAFAQAKPTASRGGDLQVGATFNLASPDYGRNTLRGLGAYATFDFRPHFGVEASFRHSSDPDGREGSTSAPMRLGLVTFSA